MIKTETLIDVYEINGKDVEHKIGELKPMVKIENHWCKYRDFVVLKFEDTTLTLNVSELRKAIENAVNSGRW